jgi:sensor histidine kinase regulating citrate/malate metabolism
VGHSSKMILIAFAVVVVVVIFLAVGKQKSIEIQRKKAAKEIADAIAKNPPPLPPGAA